MTATPPRDGARATGRPGPHDGAAGPVPRHAIGQELRELLTSGTAGPSASDTGAGQSERDAVRMSRLEDENLQLQEAVRSHAVVDQAIGVVLAVGRITPDEGWEVLRNISQHTNVKLRHVAELIVDWARTGELPGEIRSRLERELGLGESDAVG